MCICGSDKRSGFRQCCGSLSLQKKEEAIKNLQQSFEEAEVVNHPMYTKIMLITLQDLIPHLNNRGLEILTGRVGFVTKK